MPGRVDQVEHVLAAFVRVAHRHRRRLDRDAALALQIHAVEHLVALVARTDRAGLFQHPIGQRALAVIDVGDNRKIPYMVGAHSCFLVRFLGRTQ
jgi:hypothetical protein